MSAQYEAQLAQVSDTQFRRGAQEAWEMLEEERELFEDYYRKVRQAFEEMRQASGTKYCTMYRSFDILAAKRSRHPNAVDASVPVSLSRLQSTRFCLHCPMGLAGDVFVCV